MTQEDSKIKKCLWCEKILVRDGRKYCSRACFYVDAKGKPSRSPNTTFKKGCSPSPDTQFKKGTSPWNKGLKGWNSGDKNPSWKGGINFRSTNEKKHLCPKYKAWMFAVRTRDKWRCRIANNDCGGRLEAHHILNWIDYPELRYQLNNGITLCRAHHPRKWAEEKRLAPTFLELVSVSNNKIN